MLIWKEIQAVKKTPQKKRCKISKETKNYIKNQKLERSRRQKKNKHVTDELNDETDISVVYSYFKVDLIFAEQQEGQNDETTTDKTKSI